MAAGVLCCIGPIGTNLSHDVGHLPEEEFCEVHGRTEKDMDAATRRELPRGYRHSNFGAEGRER